MLRTQPHDCDADGEPFVPMDVDLVLNNPQIALRQVGNGDPTVMRGPGACRPGQPRRGLLPRLPRRLAEPRLSLRAGQQPLQRRNSPPSSTHTSSSKPTARDCSPCSTGCSGTTTTGTTNTRATGSSSNCCSRSTPEEALTKEPISVGYAQHEGGERASWTGDKIQREGERPVIYSSQRSHASYYSPSLYLGRSGAEGFGCDNTTVAVDARRSSGRAAPRSRRRPHRSSGVDRLRRPMGRAPLGTQQRSHWPEHEAAVDRARHLGRRSARQLVRRARRRHTRQRPTRHLLQRRGVGVGRLHPLRGVAGSSVARNRRDRRVAGIPRTAHVVGDRRPDAVGTQATTG